MQVRTGGVSRGPDGPEHLALLDSIPRFYLHILEVAVHGGKAVAVIYTDPKPIFGLPASR
jgi:hypothetical protein